MAERSKAPDSRKPTCVSMKETIKEFWSSIEGVGSNPTSDSLTFSFQSIKTFTDKIL